VLRTVFMGTPDFALPSLEVVVARTALALVVTQPDKPAGRGRKLHAPPVKTRAIELGVEVVQPAGSITKEVGSRLVELAPDVIIVVAFGKFLGRKVLGTPRFGCINVHASLLPRHRGADPIAWAILRGDTVTGVTVQQMVPEMDAGDVLARASTPIEPDETAGELAERLSTMGAELVEKMITGLEEGTLAAEPQDHGAATLAPPLCKRDGAIDWSAPAQKVHDHVRAMNPWPVAYTLCDRGRLRVLRTRVVETEVVAGEPGEVVQADKHGVHVACGEGVLELVEAQREGKSVARATELVFGRLLCCGERFCDSFEGDGGRQG